MKIAMLGTGYVGLVSGACLAKIGHTVYCVDLKKPVIEMLKAGKSPIYEPGIEKVIEETAEAGRLNFTTQIKEAVAECDAVFIAVGTPPRPDGSADLSQIWNAAEEIGKNINKYTLVVTKSTVPVGTGDRIKEIIKKRAKHEFSIASNPEFLREGTAVKDFMKPDRIVCGVEDDKAREMLTEIYEPQTREGYPLIFMDVKSSELTKYAANCMLAARISFMNEMANLCELFGANVNDVKNAIGADKRIGSQFLSAGIGYGGSCFPKDVKALINSSLKAGYNPMMLTAVETINKNQRMHFFLKIKDHFDGELSGRKFAVWGLSFKPNTDDIRDSPALTIIEYLRDEGAEIAAYDPQAAENVKKYYKEEKQKCPELTEDPYDACVDADALIICTEWSEFIAANLEIVKAKLKSSIIFDGRNIFNPSGVREKGFTYYPVGMK